LKAEFEAGARGDDAPAQPIWPSAREQADLMAGLLRRRPTQANETVTDADVDDVAVALRGVDWTGVRASATDRAGEVARSVRSMAEHVDWARVQPVAAQVSSALIAAVAAGRLPVGGRVGPLVARAIVDQGGLAGRVAARLEPSTLPDLRDVIDTTASET
jgi:hypothetical protein